MEQSVVLPTNNVKRDMLCYGEPALLALPDLTPVHEKIVGASVAYGRQATLLLQKAALTNAKISRVHYAHEEISALLRLGIDLDVYTEQTLTNVLTRLASDDGFDAVVTDIKHSYINALNTKVIHPVEPCKSALLALGYVFDEQTIGYLSINASDSVLHYSIHDSMEFFAVDIQRFSEEAQFVIVAIFRAFGSLAKIDTLSHETSDWELYHSISELSDKKQKKLNDIDDALPPEKALKQVKKIMGKETYDCFVSTFEDYSPIGEDDNGFASFVVQRTQELLYEVEFDKLPIFDVNYAFSIQTFSHLPEKVASLLVHVTRKEELEMIDKLMTLFETAKPFIHSDAAELESASDIHLWSQQYLHFHGFYEDLCVQRANELENHILQTGESAMVEIDPMDQSYIDAFTNLQIGYLLVVAGQQALGITP